jgi:hypothetical protein
MDEVEDVQLFCVVVGDGQPFHVDVNLKKLKVGNLKDAIKAKNEDITVPDRKMRLFLAKRGGWLDTAGAAAVRLDDFGELAQEFEEMDPALYLENDKYFGKGFEPGEGQVHVLVVVPIEHAAKRQRVELGFSGREDVAAILALAKELEGSPNLEKGTVLTVPGTVLGTEFPNGLYIRQEYWDVYGIIQNALASSQSISQVLVLGSPGIGKSGFGVFLLLLFMTKKKDVAFRPVGKRVLYYFTWSDVDGYEISVIPRAGKSYEGLFDGIERDGLFGAPDFRHVYLFASPRTTNYKPFIKEGCFQVVMNPWTKAECQSLADKNHIGDQDEWYHRFNLVGGIPRLVFSTSLGNTFDALVQRVDAAVPRSVDELKYEILVFQQRGFNDHTKHIVYHMHRDERWPSFSYLTYASLAVEALFSARLKIRAANEIQKLLQIPAQFFQSWRGREMDKFLLQDLATCKFRMRSLKGRNAGNIKHFGPLNARTEVVRVSSDISNNLALYLPLSKHFPAVDVLVVPMTLHIIYVQSTASTAHPIQYQRFKKLYEDLAGRGEFQGYTHILLFLVSNDMYGQFTAQPYQNEDGTKRKIKVKQYVGKIIG